LPNIYKTFKNLPEQISHLVKRQTVEGAAHSMPVLLSTSVTPSFYDMTDFTKCNMFLHQQHLC